MRSVQAARIPPNQSALTSKFFLGTPNFFGQYGSARPSSRCGDESWIPSGEIRPARDGSRSKKLGKVDLLSFPHARKALAALVIASSCLITANATAVTYLDDCANNGVVLTSQVSLGYLDVPSGGSTATTATFAPGSPPPPGVDHASTTVGPILVVNPTVSGSTATTPSPLVKIPAVGDPKDHVEVTAEAYFEFGTPSGTQPEDTFRFRAEGLASAVNAHLFSGNPADAHARVIHRIEFFNDLVPASGPATTCSGLINLPDLRPLEPHEATLKLEVIQNPSTTPTVLLTQAAGDPAASFALVPGTQYALRYEYEYIVPHGIDPPFDGTYSVTLASPPPVPTAPAGLVVLLLSLAGTGGWMLRTLRRRENATH